MDTVNENSISIATVAFKDENGLAVIPDHAWGKILCLTSGATIRAEIALSSLSSSVDIVIPSTENAIQNQEDSAEERVLAVRFTYASGQKQGNVEYHYSLINLFSGPLLSLAAIKSMMGIERSRTEHDATIADIIDGVVSDAEGTMEAKILKVASEVAYLDGGCSRVVLPHLNVSNVSVWFDIGKGFLGDALPSSDYVVDQRRGIVRAAHRDLFGNMYFGYSGFYGTYGLISPLNRNRLLGTVRVRYDGGYDSSTLPRDLRSKLIKQIMYEFRRREDPGLSSVTYPDGTINKMQVGEWLDDVEKVLLRYRRISI